MPHPSARLFLMIAGISGFTAVALGAFGAHALQNHVDQRQMGIYHTAVDYHFIHTLCLALTGLALCTAKRSTAMGWMVLYRRARCILR
ncbi:MAG: DUF423 domain-containing protein [Myxococcota bacterium]